jgi:hypothetical protein
MTRNVRQDLTSPIKIAIKRYSSLSALLLATMLSGCNLHILDPDYAYIARDEFATRLVLDSPAVEQLLSRNDLIAGQDWPGHTDQERIHGYADSDEHPEKFEAQRHALKNALADHPSVSILGQPYFRLLRQSTASCEPSGRNSSDVYILVRVTTGPSKGKEGWACTRDVGPTGEGVL